MNRPCLCVALALWSLAGAACSPEAAPSLANAAATSSSADCVPVLVSPWIRTAPPGASMHAGYAVLRNDCATPITVTGAQSLDFASASIHETLVEDGMSRMREAGAIDVPAHGAMAFEPGGRHLMLMQPARAFAEGDRARARLVLADGRHVFAEFEVRRDAPH